VSDFQVFPLHIDCKSESILGQPPIVVLSYKNHAIDEFLVDLVKAERAVDLIRIGNPTDPLLAHFREFKQHSFQDVIKVYRKMVQHHLHSLLPLGSLLYFLKD